MSDNSSQAETIGLLKHAANMRAAPGLRRLLSFVVWLGIGALFHAWQLGPTFEVNSLWSWGYVIAWPVAFIFAVLLPILGNLIYIAFLLLLLAVTTGFTLWVMYRVYLTIAGEKAVTWTQAREQMMREKRGQ